MELPGGHVPPCRRSSRAHGLSWAGCLVGQGSLGASPPWSRTRGSPISPASRMALLSTHPQAPLLVANPLSLSTPCQAGAEKRARQGLTGWVGRLFQALSPSDWAFGCGMLQPAAREPWAWTCAPEPSAPPREPLEGGADRRWSASRFWGEEPPWGQAQGSGQWTGSPASPCLTRSYPCRARTASHLAMSPSPCSRRSMAFGPFPQPSLQPPFMKRSPIRASLMACPRLVAHLLALIGSWKAATRKASRGPNPPTGEAGARIPTLLLWGRGLCRRSEWRTLCLFAG